MRKWLTNPWIISLVSVALTHYLLPGRDTMEDWIGELIRRLRSTPTDMITMPSVFFLTSGIVSLFKYYAKRRKDNIAAFKKLEEELHDILYGYEFTSEIEYIKDDKPRRNRHTARCLRLSEDLSKLRIRVPRVPTIEKCESREDWTHFLKEMTATRDLRKARKLARVLKKSVTYPTR